MDKKELNKWLVTEVMKWVQIKGYGDNWYPLKYIELLKPYPNESGIVYSNYSKAADTDKISNWNPTENISQAMKCLEGLYNDFIFKLHRNPFLKKNQWVCKIICNLTNQKVESYCKTPSEAICQAIYKALKGDKE